MIDSILLIAKSFLNIPTAPFREHLIRDFIIQFCTERKINYVQDDYGNIIVALGKHTDKPILAFVAHMDHPGFIVENDSKDTTTTALFYGNWSPLEFNSAPIRIFSNQQRSVKACADKWERAIEEGAWRAFMHVEDFVNQGDIGMWDFDPFKIEGGLLFSRNCDDSIGCILMLTLLDYYHKNQTDKTFRCIFTCAEEAGLHGAKYIASSKALPDKCIPISVETSRELPVAKIGDGVIIRVGDLKTIFSPEVTDTMVSIAKQIKVDDPHFLYQRKLMDGGQCEGSVFTLFDYRTGALSIPLGNYHNRNFETKMTEPEYVSINDVENACKLMIRMVENSGLFLTGKGNPTYKDTKGLLGQWFLEEGK